MDPAQVNICMIPFGGAALAFLFYRYVLAGEDISVIFAEDEADV